MRRRDLIKGIVGLATAWPLAARAQQAAIPTVGVLATPTPASYTQYVAAFLQGLKESGYVEGQNVAVEFRWAEGHYD
jgi:putative tryptophan/tyrosine transport system substrate-binding protein